MSRSGRALLRPIVDASAAFDQGAGIGRYSRGVINELIAVDASVDWTLVRAPANRGHATFSPFDGHAPSNARVVGLPFSRRRADQLWFRARVPLDVRIFVGGGNVVYSPDFTAPPARGVPHVVTVHDLAFLTHPEFATDALRRYLSSVVPRQIAAAAAVIAVSEATRADLVRYLDVDSGKITLATNGIDARFFAATPPTPEQRLRLGLPDQYLLMLGTIEPRKNHRAALEAIEIVSKERGDVTLVIAGRYGWGAEDVVDEIRRLETRGIVRWLDYVPEADLPALYAGSRAVVYPSWTEGFGLPVAEALATGRPVITGTAPALREAGGTSATYVDPADTDGIAEAMLAAFESKSAEVETLERTNWARRFTWKASAAAIGNVLRTVANTA